MTCSGLCRFVMSRKHSNVIKHDDESMLKGRVVRGYLED